MQLNFYCGKKFQHLLICPNCNARLDTIIPITECKTCQSITLSTRFTHIIKENAPTNAERYVTVLAHLQAWQKGVLLGVCWDQALLLLSMVCPEIQLTIAGHDIDNNVIIEQLHRMFPHRLRLIENKHLHPTSYSNHSLDFICLDTRKKKDDILEDMNQWFLKIKQSGAFVGRHRDQDEVIQLLEEIGYYKKGPEDSWSIPIDPAFLTHSKNKLQLAKKQLLLRNIADTANVLDDTHPEDEEEEIEKACLQSNWLFALGLANESLELVQTVKKLQVQDPRIVLQEAKYAFGNDNFDLAEDLCSQSLKTFSDNLPLRMMLGNIFRLSKKYEKALHEFSIIKEKRGKDPLIHYKIGSLLQDLVEQKTAIKAYQTGLTHETISKFKLKEQTDLINIVCVFTGDKYPVDYVYKLYASIKRFCNQPYRFICFTDNPLQFERSIETINIASFGFEGWWNKLLLFNHAFHKLEGPLFYIDLDEVIVDWIDPLMLIDQEVMMMKDRYLPFFNTSVLLLNTTKLQTIFDRFNFDIAKQYHGDQDWVSECYPYAQLFPTRWLPSFTEESEFLIPEGGRVVCFYGYPKPHAAPAKWIKHYWKN